MDKKEKLRIVLTDKRLRIPFLERDFFRFCRYYFPHYFKRKSPAFHKEWAKAYQSDKNLFFEGFRGSAKTTFLTMFYAYSIAYRKSRFITHYCYASDSSEAFLFDLVVELQTNARIIEDFGTLFPSAGEKKKKKEKAGVSEFVTTNEIRVKAMSIGKTPRGLLYKTSDGAFRPDLVGLDDIDTMKTVSNPRLVTKAYDFIKNEIVGGLGPKSKIVFLGNVIKPDGCVPRLKRDYANSKRWSVFSQPIYDSEGNIVWSERYCETDAEAELTGKESIESIKAEQGSTAFAQNYLLIPAQEGETVIRREHIRFGYVEAKRIVIGVDPAFSTKSLSDNFAIAVSAHGEDGKKCVRAVYALKGKNKEPEYAIDFIAKLYRESGANVVHFESVAFQTVLAKMLRDKGIAVREVKPHADKVTRLMEFQPSFERGEILFDRDGPGIDEAIEEILAFPGGMNDDRVDAMMYALQDYKHFDITFG